MTHDLMFPDVSICMQCVGPFLDVQWPQAALVPVRTKKRYFIPPAVGLKEKSHSEQEARARAAGVVIRQEYMERPINISCTGSSRLQFVDKLNILIKC